MNIVTLQEPAPLRGRLYMMEYMWELSSIRYLEPFLLPSMNWNNKYVKNITTTRNTKNKTTITSHYMTIMTT